MRFHIKELVLWPRDPTIEPKRWAFTAGELNVISGVSRTGKSAVIPIIDYCLGSESCQIPVNTIRDRCAWFGVVVSLDEGEMLLARKEPGNQRTTSDMFVLSGPAVVPPMRIDMKNASVDVVKRTLDQLAGLTQLDFDPEGTGTGFRGRPSFRDLVAFTFQPQNIIANQNILFFKADTHEHREKLRTIFPYVLGAISPSTLAKQHELNQLRRDLLRKERELSSLKEVSYRWLSEIRAWASQGRELGVVPRDVDVNAPITSLIDALRSATEKPQQSASLTAEAVDGSIAELVALQEEERGQSTAIAQARRRLSEMEQLRETTSAYGDQLHLQRDRLKIAEWLKSLHAETRSCPVCGQELGADDNSLDPLLHALSDIEHNANQVAGIPAVFDRELQRVGAELRRATEQLEGIRHRIRALTRASDAARARQDSEAQSSRFIGRLEQALEHYERLGNDGGLAAEVDILKERVRFLDAELRATDTAKRTDLALRRLSALMQPLLPQLDAERPTDPVSFSIPDLTVRVAGRDREDYLWEIGSGSNWLSYHLSLILALHKFWLELPHSAVPAMVIIDQPSQVYFPKQLSAAQMEGDAEPYKDEDVEAVQRIFAALASAVRAAAGRLQIIVLDHATDTVWGSVTPLRVAGQWRGGEKLVPDTWPGRAT